MLDVFEPAVARQLEEARATVERLIATGRGESMAAFGTLCLLYLRYELLDAAEPCLRQARSLEPAEFRWPYYLAFVYTRAADLARAGESVAAALALRPDDVPALLRAGDLHLLAHDTAKAEAAFANALAIDPRSDAARFGLGGSPPREASTRRRSRSSKRRSRASPRAASSTTISAWSTARWATSIERARSSRRTGRWRSSSTIR